MVAWDCATFSILHFSAIFAKEDEGFINQQGVHELFADILFADPADLDEDNSSVDEDALFSASRSGWPNLAIL